MRTLAVILAVMVVGASCQMYRGRYRNRSFRGQGLNYGPGPGHGPGAGPGPVNVSPGFGVDLVDLEVIHVRHGDHIDTITRKVPHVYTGNGINGGIGPGHGNHGPRIAPGFGGPGFGTRGPGITSGFVGHGIDRHGPRISPGFGGHGHGDHGPRINPGFGGHGHGDHGLRINPGFGGHGHGDYGPRITPGFGGHGHGDHGPGHSFGSHGHGNVGTSFVQTKPGVYQRALGHHLDHDTNMKTIAFALACLVAGAACQVYNARHGRGHGIGRQARVTHGHGVNHYDYETRHIQRGDTTHTITQRVPHLYTGNSHLNGHGHGRHDIGYNGYSGYNGLGNLNGYQNGFNSRSFGVGPGIGSSIGGRFNRFGRGRRY
ncbi:uncharacterized protein [Haliotis cracherodii]|uniref:uncharacterized protein n=1 Tax=Haliotis cracherodii TaxID=6455 RepID=UPI0039EC1106